MWISLSSVRMAAIAAGVLVMAQTPAAGSPILFDNQAAFDVAVGNSSVVTFEQFAFGVVPSCLPFTPFIPDPCVFQTGGVRFVTTTGLQMFNQRPILTIENGTGAPNPSTKGLQSSTIARVEDEFFFTFQGDVVGFSVISGNLSTYRVVLTDSVGFRTTSDITAGPFVPTFFGAIESEGLSRVSIFALGNGSNFAIDNVAVRAVPEPAVTLLAFVSVVAALIQRRPRRCANGG